jgi:hypothetical protein
VHHFFDIVRNAPIDRPAEGWSGIRHIDFSSYRSNPFIADPMGCDKPRPAGACKSRQPRPLRTRLHFAGRFECAVAYDLAGLS